MPWNVPERRTAKKAYKHLRDLRDHLQNDAPWQFRRNMALVEN